MQWLLPKPIHAVTLATFELKVVLFVLAVSIQRLPLFAGRRLSFI
jgi:hypothetical protein